MNKEDVRQKMLDIVGDIYNAKFVEHGLNGYTKFDGHTLDEAKYTINRAFDDLTIDHHKVKLPREVGEELEDWMKVDSIDTIITDIVWLTDDHMAVRNWWDSTPDATYLIADMARYGWEAEPEERFYVLGPESWENRNAVHDRQCNGELDTGIHFSDEGPSPLETPDEEYAFTRAELKQYHLDSDVFMLVPVGE